MCQASRCRWAQPGTARVRSTVSQSSTLCVRPAHRVDVQAVQHARAWLCHRAPRRQWRPTCAAVRSALRAPERALQLAGDKGNQGLLHLRLLGRRQGKARIGLAHEVREGEQVRRQRVTALAGPAARPLCGWEVHGQAIVIQVGRQAAHECCPHIRIVQPHRSAGGLLQAAVGVALPPGAQTGHALLRVGQLRAERQTQATFAQQRPGRAIAPACPGARPSALARTAAPSKRHGRQQALADGERIAGSAGAMVACTLQRAGLADCDRAMSA